MRNDSEFKNEVFLRLDMIKHKRKIKKRIILSVIPLLLSALIIGAVTLFDGGLIAQEECFDGAADGAVGEIFETNESVNKNNKNDGEGNDLATGGSTLTDDCIANDDRIYTDRAKIDGFRAMLGEFSEAVVTEGTAFKVIGTNITLIYGDLAEKYIIAKDKIYTEDITKYQVIDEEKSKEIENFLRNNPSDK